MDDVAFFNSKMERNPKWVNAEIGMTLDWSGTVGKYKAAARGGNFDIGLPIFVENGKDQSIKFKPSMILAVNNSG